MTSGYCLPAKSSRLSLSNFKLKILKFYDCVSNQDAKDQKRLFIDDNKVLVFNSFQPANVIDINISDNKKQAQKFEGKKCSLEKVG